MRLILTFNQAYKKDNKLIEMASMKGPEAATANVNQLNQLKQACKQFLRDDELRQNVFDTVTQVIPKSKLLI